MTLSDSDSRAKIISLRDSTILQHGENNKYRCILNGTTTRSQVPIPLLRLSTNSETSLDLYYQQN